MLTPLDIESKVFTRAVSGYNATEVKNFMKDILSHYEKLYKENIELKDKLHVVNEGIQYYKNIEQTLQHTLVLAEKMAEDTKGLARQHAEHIEKEAQLKADVIINEAQHEVRKINHIREELLQSYSANQIQIKQILKSQLEMAEKLEMDLHSSTHIYDHLFHSEDLNNAVRKPASATTIVSDEAVLDSDMSESELSVKVDLKQADLVDIDETAVLFES